MTERCCAAQAVKLWSVRGEALGVIRPAASLLSSPRAAHGPAPLAFHPLHLTLAAGGAEPTVTLYDMKPPAPTSPQTAAAPPAPTC